MSRAEKRTTRDLGSGRATRLLVVDDRDDNLTVLEEVIEAYLPECEVVTATSAAVGLRHAAREPVDGALIDLQMPVMDGIEMCRRLKAEPATARMPVMLLTSHRADPTTKARGLEAGADDFISRPIDNLELIGRIRVMLRIKRAEDELRTMNAHLEELVALRTEKLREAVRRQAMLSQRVLAAQEDERARLSRELHDELGQVLTALQYEIAWLRGLVSTDPGQAARSFDTATEMVQSAVGELRRICRGLRPPLLDDLGVEAALRSLVEEVGQRVGLITEISISIDGVADRVSPEVSLCTYRVLQESLNNVARHADATKVTVTLEPESDELVLSVADDGCGFDPNATVGSGGSGIDGMRERASVVGGSLEIESQPSGGTTIVLRSPLHHNGRNDDQDSARR